MQVKSRTHETVAVRPSAGCPRVLQRLQSNLKGGLSGESTIDDANTSTPRGFDDKHPGGATWTVQLWLHGDAECSARGWQERVSSSRLRPDKESLYAAYNTWISCDRRATDPKRNELRYPGCWRDDFRFSEKIQCSRYKFEAPPMSSSGLNSWRGGNI